MMHLFSHLGIAVLSLLLDYTPPKSSNRGYWLAKRKAEGRDTYHGYSL